MPTLSAAVILAVALTLTACSGSAPEAPVETTSQVGRTETQWLELCSSQVNLHLADAVNTFVYVLPSASSPSFAETYKRQLDNATADMQRGVNGKALVAFCAPDSAKAAVLAVAVLSKVRKGKFDQNVRVMFIGSRADSERVEALVKRAGAKYQFVES